MKLGPGLSPFNRSEPRRLLKWFALCRPVVSTSETDHKGHPCADVPVIKYASGFAMYDTRLAMTSGSAMGIFIMSELAIPEAFAV